MTQGEKPRFLDRNHPFFAKVWVRGLTVLLPAAMAALDFTMTRRRTRSFAAAC